MTDTPVGLPGTWAIVELFGHTVLAGYCTEEMILGQPMLKVQVPEGRPDGRWADVEPSPAFEKIVGPSAIFGITPCSEEQARAVVDYHRPKQCPVYVPEKPLLIPAGSVQQQYEDEHDDSMEVPF